MALVVAGIPPSDCHAEVSRSATDSLNPYAYPCDGPTVTLSPRRALREMRSSESASASLIYIKCKLFPRFSFVACAVVMALAGFRSRLHAHHNQTAARTPIIYR